MPRSLPTITTKPLTQTLRDVLDLWTEDILSTLPPLIPEAAGAYCARCGTSCGPGVALSDGCPSCRRRRLPWQRVYRLGAYQAPLRDMLLQLKYAGQWQMGEHLGQVLGNQMQQPLTGEPLVIPVPLPRIRHVWRGYNQALLLARGLAAHTGWEISEALVRRDWRVLHRRNLIQRQTLSRAFQPHRLARKRIQGRTCVLVDDILTSGATAKACARILKANGATSVILAVAAVTDPPGLRPPHTHLHAD